MKKVPRWGLKKQWTQQRCKKKKGVEAGDLKRGDINQVLDPKEQSAIRIYHPIPSGVSLLLHEVLVRHSPKRLWWTVPDGQLWSREPLSMPSLLPIWQTLLSSTLEMYHATLLFFNCEPFQVVPHCYANDSQESCVFLEGQNPVIVFSCFLLATVQNKSVLPLQFIPLRFLLQPSIFHVNNGTDTF